MCLFFPELLRYWVMLASWLACGSFSCKAFLFLGHACDVYKDRQQRSMKVLHLITFGFYGLCLWCLVFKNGLARLLRLLRFLLVSS